MGFRQPAASRHRPTSASYAKGTLPLPCLCPCNEGAQCRMHSEGLLQGPGLELLCQPLWADDVLVPVWAPTAADLEAVSVATSRHIHAVYTRRALRINYARGKTEILLVAHGKGSRSELGRLLGRRGCLTFSTGTATQDVRLCTSYTHLGSLLSGEEHGHRDMVAKLARAKHAVVPLAQPVLRNTDVPEHVRRLVLSSLGLSVALHNVGIWTSLPDNAMNAWMNGIGDLYRLLAPEDRHTHHPDCPDVRSVAGRCGLPYPATLLTEQRLLHFMRIVVQERVELWDLLMVEFSCSCYSWLHLVLQDIAFLRYWQPRVLTADCWDRLVQSPVELMVWVSDHSRVFRRLIARAIDAQSKSLRHWYLRQKEVRVAAAQRSPAVTSESCEARTCDLCVSCPDCPLTFGSVNALAAHQALQHGAIKLARQYCSGNTCPACLMNYSTHERLVRHLQFSGSPCLAIIVASRRPLGECTPSQRQTGGIPAVRASGPLQPPPKPTQLLSELVHVASTLSCFDVRALELSVRALCHETADIIACFADNSVGPSAAQHEAPTMNPDGWALARTQLAA